MGICSSKNFNVFNLTIADSGRFTFSGDIRNGLFIVDWVSPKTGWSLCEATNEKNLVIDKYNFFTETFVLGHLSVYPPNGMLSKDYFLAQSVTFFVDKYRKDINFPKCNYLCKKVTIHVSVGLSERSEGVAIRINNSDCPVPIEIYMISGMYDVENYFSFICENKNLVEVKPRRNEYEIFNNQELNSILVTTYPDRD